MKDSKKIVIAVILIAIVAFVFFSRKDGNNTNTDETTNNKTEKIYVVSAAVSDDDVNKWEFSYDENGNLIEEKIFYYDAHTHGSKYEYDKNGYSIKVTDTIGESVTVIEYENNESGYPVKGIVCDVFGEFEEIEYQYEFRENGKPLSCKMLYYNEGVEFVEDYEFDENGCLTREVFDENDESKLYTECEYRYDRHGHCTDVWKYWKSGTTMYEQYIYQYDENGYCIKRYYYVDGELINVLNYEYISIEVPADRVEIIKKQQAEIIF